MGDDVHMLGDDAELEALVTGSGGDDHVLSDFLWTVRELSAEGAPPLRQDVAALLTGVSSMAQRRRRKMCLAAAAALTGVAVGLGGAAAASETVRAPLRNVLQHVVGAVGFRFSWSDGHESGDESSGVGLKRPPGTVGSAQRPGAQPLDRAATTSRQRVLALLGPTAPDPADIPVEHGPLQRGHAGETASAGRSRRAEKTLQSPRGQTDRRDSGGSQSGGGASQDQGDASQDQGDASQDQGGGSQGQDGGSQTQGDGTAHRGGGEHRGDGSKGGHDRRGQDSGGDKGGSDGQGQQGRQQ